jgi:hypothetical protein
MNETIKVKADKVTGQTNFQLLESFKELVRKALKKHKVDLDKCQADIHGYGNGPGTRWEAVVKSGRDTFSVVAE